MSAHNVANDRAARERALDPHGSFIVQAPAGSGKTELLIQRMLSLLARAEHPSEILAVTFTKKAAGEMRERLLAAIAAARNEPEPSASPERERWQLAKAVVARDAALGWQLAARPMLLNIDTFDAFSLRVAKFAPLGTQSQQGALASLQEDASALHREAARRAVLDASDEAHVAAVSALLIALDNRTESVVGLLGDLLAKRALWMDRLIDDSDEAVARMRAIIVASIERRIVDVAVHWPQEMTPRVTALAAYASEHASDATRQAIALAVASSSFAASTLQTLKDWQALAPFLLTTEPAWRKQFNKSGGFPAPSDKGIDKEEKAGRTAAKEAITKLLEDLQTRAGAEALRQALVAVASLPDAAAIAAHEPILRAALYVLKMAASELMLIERSRAVTDFSGVSLAARLALVEYRDEVFARFESRIRHILVDEFQDTNPAQAALIETLVEDWREGDGRSLFLVGDPMQSIYAFRDADVGIFVDAWSHGVAALRLTPLTLTANYRSRAAIVDWVNATLEPVFAKTPPSQDLPRVPFARAHATRDDSSQAKRPERWAFADPSEEAQAIVRDIARVRGTHPQDRVAVIVRAKRHASEVLRELQAARIDFTARDMASWSDRPLIRDLLSLTYVLAQPGDRLSWFAWLRSPMVGLSLATFASLGEWQERERCATWVALADPQWRATLPPNEITRIELATQALSQANKAAHLGTLAERVHLVFRACGGEAIAATDEAREELAAYLAFLDVQTADGFLPPRKQFEGVLARQFRSFSVRIDVDADADGNANPNAADASPPVEVLTMHKAKGLEWHHVYLPQLDRANPPETRELITWNFVRNRPLEKGDALKRRNAILDTRRQPSQLLVAAKESRRRVENSVFQFVHDLGVAARGEEMKRLLYVAATRARERLVLSGCATKAGQTPRAGTLAALIDWPTADREPSENAEEVAPAQRTTMRGSLQRVTPLNVGTVESSAPGQLPAASAPRGANFATADSGEHRHEIALGIVGHKLIEGYSHALRDGRAYAPNEASIARWLTREGMSASQTQATAAALVDALAAMEKSKHFAFIHDRQHTDAADEATIIDPTDPTRTLRVDRTFIDATGTRWIVDYKFSKPPQSMATDDTALERWISAQAREHAVQLEAYAAAFAKAGKTDSVAKALYFPRIDAWWVYPR